MIISDVLKTKNRPIETIEQSRTVLEAIQLLVSKGIGSLLVLDEGQRIAGIITERDILRESASRSGMLASTKVHQVMTARLVTGRPEDPVTEILDVMTKHRIRHVPIMRGEELAGMVSIGDLVKVQLEEAASENQHLKEYIQSPR